VKQHRKGLSLFQLIDRKKFDALVKKHAIDRSVRSFKTWELPQALICSFVMRLGSFREVESALKIPDSTFGDALRLRHCEFFKDLCDVVLLEIRGKSESRKCRKAIRQILAIDSSEIDVHGSLFDEPGWKKKYTIGHKASGKIHIVWNVDGQWVEDFLITPDRKGDSPISLQLRLLPGKMYVFDRAYNDFDFWQKVVTAKSDFVTRLKDCARYRKLQKSALRGNQKKTGVIYDGPFVSTALSARKSKLKLRHVIYRDPLTQKIFHFVTSDKRVSAKVIAEIYKSRWAVELLFRWLKGHLDIRRLATKNPNAIRTQLAVAVLVQLLLQLKKTIDKFSGTLWDLLRTVRTGLCQIILVKYGVPDGCRWSSALASASTA
jgi:hypothetical protein